jgi:indole-3-glycerol phosphate synthase
MAVLDVIVARKREELARSSARLPRTELSRLAEAAPSGGGFAGALTGGSGPRVIAEVKRASPSKGVLRPEIAPLDYRPEDVARAYAAAGARALSVLTDVSFFWGNPDALAACRAAASLPVLRKDFILDPYQVDESRWLGADAILLIVRILDDAAMRACAERARELGMDVLAEVHADDELERALRVEGAIIGVNHRDLGTMQLDMDRALRLCPRIPEARVVVAESGLRSRADLARLEAAGIDAFLVGEALVSRPDPGAALAELTRS